MAPSTLDDIIAGSKLTGTRKAAILLVALGVEAAGKVLRFLNENEIEAISLEVARVRNVPSETIEQVLQEYNEISVAQRYISQGGLNFAREALETAMGSRRAEEVMTKVESAMEVSAFYLLQTVETGQLLNFLQNEHPQTAALILAHLKPRKAADIISVLTPDMQAEIMWRLGTMSKTSPELLRDIEEVIRDQMGAVFGSQLSVTGGAESVASILNAVSRAAERNIMDTIRDRDPELAATIRNYMFVFDDLINVSDRDIQRLMKEIEQKDLVLALRGAQDELVQKVLRNTSERVSVMITEEMDLLGPVRVRDVEQAQRRILDIAQILEEQEEIVLTHGKEDAFI